MDVWQKAWVSTAMAVTVTSECADAPQLVCANSHVMHMSNSIDSAVPFAHIPWQCPDSPPP